MLCPALIDYARDEVSKIMEVNKAMGKHREEIRLQRSTGRDDKKKKKKGDSERGVPLLATLAYCMGG